MAERAAGAALAPAELKEVERKQRTLAADNQWSVRNRLKATLLRLPQPERRSRADLVDIAALASCASRFIGQHVRGPENPGGHRLGQMNGLTHAADTSETNLGDALGGGFPNPCLLPGLRSRWRLSSVPSSCDIFVTSTLLRCEPARAGYLVFISAHLVLYRAPTQPVEKRVDLCRVMTLESYRKGATIVHEGDAGTHYYVLLTGSCTMVAGEQVSTKDGKPKLETQAMAKGVGFGEMALVTGKPQLCSILAESNTDLLLIDKTTYLRVFQQDESKLELILNFLLQEVRALKHVDRR
jgi:hypothetical protein